MKALKLEEIKSDKISSSLLNKEWLSLQDIRLRINELLEKQEKLQPLEIQEIIVEDSKKSSCLCHCFSRMFSSRKKTDQTKCITTPSATSPNKPSLEVANGFHMNGKTSDSQSTLNSNNRLNSIAGSKYSLDSLRSIAELLQNKADNIYAHLRDSSTKTNAEILRYFEQDRGVLVLETHTQQQGVIIVNICTKKEQLERIRRDYASGKLTRDLETCVNQSDKGVLLDSVGARAIKLQINVDKEQLLLAEQELV